MNTEQKALALINEVRMERNVKGEYPFTLSRESSGYDEAFCRLIERHEAFRQEVSEAASFVLKHLGRTSFDRGSMKDERQQASATLSRFIIAPPFDPLVEAMTDACRAQGMATEHTPGELTGHLRAALAKHGLQITGVET